MVAFGTVKEPVLKLSAMAYALASPAAMLLSATAAGTELVALDLVRPIEVLSYVLLGLALTAPLVVITYWQQASAAARAAAGRVDEVPELVEDEAAPQEPGQDLVDTVEFGVEGGIVRGLPGPGALEADPVPMQELAHSLPTDADPTVWVAGQVGGEFAQAPASEGQARLSGAGLGRRHDERFVVGADQARTASRPAN